MLPVFPTRRFLRADRRARGVSQSGTSCPIVLVPLTARFQAPQRGPNAPWNPMNALPVKSRRCLCQLRRDWWKVALEAPEKFLLIGNVAVDGGPFVPPLPPPPPPLILEWSVCQGDTLSLASMSRLFRQLSGPWRIGPCFKTSRFHFQNCLCAPIQTEGEAFRSGPRRDSFPNGVFFDSDVYICLHVSAALRRTEQLKLEVC